jgi:purine-binding chemotaxis protein CheW
MVANYLVCRAAHRLCAVPLQSVVEIMRPMPVERFGSAPGFVCGLALVRGSSAPVVDLGYLLRAADEALPPPPERFVCLKLHARHVVLAVDAVIGVRMIQPEELRAVPPLLESSRYLQALLHLDAELCSVLDVSWVLAQTPTPESMLTAASAAHAERPG